MSGFFSDCAGSQEIMPVEIRYYKIYRSPHMNQLTMLSYFTINCMVDLSISSHIIKDEHNFPWVLAVFKIPEPSKNPCVVVYCTSKSYPRQLVKSQFPHSYLPAQLKAHTVLYSVTSLTPCQLGSLPALPATCRMLQIFAVAVASQ
jgi:hypothetical protein